MFHGERFYVLTFGAVYPKDHSRYSFGAPHAFIMFQPDASFKRYANSSGRISDKARETIRDRYLVAGRPYGLTYVVTPIEAQSFVMPLLDEGGPVEWWNSPRKGRAA
ncbi:hypothetical protein GCM10027282_27790 [Frigoribacterium salinisoli]